jgi:hypothetical protein
MLFNFFMFLFFVLFVINIIEFHLINKILQNDLICYSYYFLLFLLLTILTIIKQYYFIFKKCYFEMFDLSELIKNKILLINLCYVLVFLVGCYFVKDEILCLLINKYYVYYYSIIINIFIVFINLMTIITIYIINSINLKIQSNYSTII